MNQYLIELEEDKFLCMAESHVHAEEQAENAYPKQKILRVYSVTLLVDYE